MPSVQTNFLQIAGAIVIGIQGVLWLIPENVHDHGSDHKFSG